MSKKNESKKEDLVMLTPEEMRIKSLADAASEKGPIIENLEERFQRIEMEVPKHYKKAEFAYRWIARDNIDRELFTNGGLFEIVTRSNHSHIPVKDFRANGAIMYSTDLILCFTRRQISDVVQKRTIEDFNLKADDKIQNPGKVRNEGGKEVARIERVEGKVGPVTPGTEPENLTSESDYHFGDTGG